LLNEPDEAEVSDEVTEARIRRSLGLMSSPTPANNHSNTSSQTHGSGGGNLGGAIQRRRFVRDGEVPVTILHPKSEAENRHAAALADMTRQRDAERAARLRAEQALHDAQVMIQTLQTRIAHAEIAKSEIAQAETVFAEVARPEPAPAPAPAAIPVPTLAAPEVEPEVLPVTSAQPVEAQSAPPRQARSRRAKPPVAAESEEPTPVKWWR
jgi:hypothetical protein